MTVSIRNLTSTRLLQITLISSMALVPMIALRYRYNPLSIVMSWIGFLLLLASAAGLWAFTKRPAFRQSSELTRQSTIIGLLLGLLWMVEIGINNFLAPPLPGRDIIDNVFWAAIALGILLCACVTVYRTGLLREGVAAGAWMGFASGAVACWMALMLTVFGMPFILRDPVNVAEWSARGPGSGSPSMACYFAYETFAGAFLHLILLGILMGALLGAVGGALGKGLRIVHRRSGSSEGKR